MSYIARMVDSEGVTWAEFAIECPYPVLRMPVPPRFYAKLEDPDYSDVGIRTADFQLERRDGGGTLIYRLVDV